MPIVEMAFTAGLDQGTDPRRTVKLTALDNYVWTKRGMIEKRPGYTLVPTIIEPTLATSSVASVAVAAGGSGYTTPNFFVFGSGGGGAGFVGVATASGGVVKSVSLVGSNAPGYGYTSPPTLLWNEPSIGGGSGSGAAGTVTLTTPSGAGGSLANAYTLATSPQGTLQATDGTNVYAYASDASAWNALGAFQNVGVSTKPTPLLVQSVPPNDASGHAVASIQTTNWLVVACNQSFVWWPPTSHAAVQDQVSGAFQPTNKGVILGAGGAVNSISALVTDGSTYVWQFGAGGSGAAVSFSSLSMGTAGSPFETDSQAFPDPITPTSLVVDTWFDAVWDAPNGRLITAYVATGDTHITLKGWLWDNVLLRWTWDNVLLATLAIAPSGAFAMYGLNVAVGATGITYVAWAYGDASGNSVVRAGMWDPTFGGTRAQALVFAAASNHYTNTITNVSCAETPGSQAMHVAFTSIEVAPSGSAAQGFANCLHSVGLDSTCTPQTATCTQGHMLASRIFVQGGRPMALAYNMSGSAQVLFDVTGAQAWNNALDDVSVPATKLAFINPRVSFGWSGGAVSQLYARLLGYYGTLPSATPLGSGAWMVPTTLAPEPATSAAMTLQQCRITYGVAPTSPAVAWTSMTYPGSVPAVAGSNTVHEVQFMQPPTIVNVNETSFGGSGLSAGEYTWVATYARVNDDGSITESPPSAPFTLNLTSGGAVTAIVTTYALSGAAVASSATLAAVYVLLYRSLVNAGSTLYRVASDPFAVGFSTSGGGAANDTRVPSVTIGDGATDAAIADSVQLYTDGGVFDNVCPSACSYATRVRDRVYLAGTPDGFTVYYSDAIQNTGTTNFHDEQTITTDDDGPVTGVSALNSNTVIFKGDAIYVVYGAEGNNAGAGNTLTTPAILVSGIGCIAPDSIVYTAQGVWFQSARGIELLDLNMSVQFAGEPVKDATSGQTIVAALDYPAQRQIRFYLASGGVVVYSTLTGEWSTFGYPTVTTATTSATLYNGAPAWASAGPTIQLETPTLYADASVGGSGGSWIASSFTTGDLTLGEGLQGYRRYVALDLLGAWNSESGLSVILQTDYSSTPSQLNAFTSSQIEAIPGFDSSRLQVEIRPKIQKAEAVRVTVGDIAPVDGTVGKGIAWESLQFEVVAKQGRYRGLSSAAKG